MPSGNPISPDPVTLAYVAEYLASRSGVGRVDEVARRSATDLVGESWRERLHYISEAVGLRVWWVTATPAEALEMARKGSPITTCTADSSGRETWWIAERDSRGRAFVCSFTQGELSPRTGSGLDSLPPAPHTWAIVASANPAGLVRQHDPSAPPPSPTARLWSLFQAESSDIGAIVLHAIAVGLLSLGTPITVQVLINWLAFGALQQPIIALSIVLLICLTLAAVLRGLQRLAVEMVQRRIFVRMVADLSARLTRVRIRAFDDQYGPELVNRFFDVLTVQKAVSTLLLDGLGAALQALVGLGLLALYHPTLFAYDVAILIVLVAILLGLGRGAPKTAIKESKAKYAVAFWMEELARHPMVFKLGGERLALERADILTRDYLEARDAHWKIYFRQVLAAWGAQAFASVALLAIAGSLVLDGELSIGQLVAAEFIVTSALAGFAKFAHKLDTFYDLLAGIDKLGQLVDLPEDEHTGYVPPPSQLPASAALERAVGRYPGIGRQVGPFTLTVPAGSRLAVWGPPGSGKSTVCDLLLGVRRPAAGRVLRDGRDVSDLRPSSLYRDAVLARGVDILHGTVRDNVALGRPDVPLPEVQAALDAVGLADVIGALPKGIETTLGPTGSPMSTSEALRLMVARALVARPRLLVIDGLFDGIPDSERRALLAPLLDPKAPWSLVVFTELPEVLPLFPASTQLHVEVSHAAN